MEKSAAIDLIQKLSNVYGISAFEDEVTALFKDEVAGSGKVSEDHMRNVFVQQKKITTVKNRLLNWMLIQMRLVS